MPIKRGAIGDKLSTEDYRLESRFLDRVLSFRNKSKTLVLFYKMDLDFWDCFKEENYLVKWLKMVNKCTESCRLE